MSHPRILQEQKMRPSFSWYFLFEIRVDSCFIHPNNVQALIKITIHAIVDNSNSLYLGRWRWISTYLLCATVFWKGKVASMTSALFCDQCGAVLPAQAVFCPACRHYFGVSLASPSLPIQATQTSFPHSMEAFMGTFAGELRPGTLFAQRYRILEQVGEGGFGSIYKAEDIDAYRRLVAIKQINLRLLSPQRMIEATDSFNREVGHLSRLKHGHIPRIYDYFTDPDHWYIIMEYIKGETLENKLKKARRGRFSTQQVFDIGIALCDELGYLHTQSPPIIFRDVKPGNIMQTGTGRIYLIDFGIARHYAPGQSRDTSPLGSPGYAAPEQYGKAQTTTQTDIYGLAATLQTLLTGKEPLEILLEGALHHHTIPKTCRCSLQVCLSATPLKDHKTWTR